jgi:hypothetical protein
MSEAGWFAIYSVIKKRVRVLVRDAKKIQGQNWAQSVEIIEGNASNVRKTSIARSQVCILRITSFTPSTLQQISVISELRWQRVLQKLPNVRKCNRLFIWVELLTMKTAAAI